MMKLVHSPDKRWRFHLSARYDCRGWFFVYLQYLHIYIYIYIYTYEKKNNPFFITDLCLLLDGAFVKFGYVFSITFILCSKLIRGIYTAQLICVLCVHICSHSLPAFPRVYISLSISTNRENHQTTAMIQLWFMKNNSLICI